MTSNTTVTVPILTARASRINQAHRNAVAAGRSMLAYAIEAGKELIAVKQGLPHGEFQPWCAANLSFSVRQARRYITLSKTDVDVPFEDLTEAWAKLNGNAKTPSAPQTLTADDAQRILKLSRMANGGNHHEEAVAQEMLDKMASRFGMTGEEAQASAERLCPEPPSNEALVDRAETLRTKMNQRLSEIEREVRETIEKEGVEGAITALTEVIYGLMYLKGKQYV